MLETLLTLAFGPALLVVVIGITAALAWPLAVAVHEKNKVPMRAAAAGTSPLRLLVPFGALMLTSPVGWVLPVVGEPILHALALLPWPLWIVLQAGLIAWQLSLIVRILPRRGEWPSVLVPFMLFIGLTDAIIVLVDFIGAAFGAGVKS
jgi:hypothetical protein